MPPRRVLREINGNVVKRKELTPHKRGIIEGLTLAGLSRSEVAKASGSSLGTVKTTIHRAPLRQDSNS